VRLNKPKRLGIDNYESEERLPEITFIFDQPAVSFRVKIELSEKQATAGASHFVHDAAVAASTNES